MLLPTSKDDVELRGNFMTLITRILVTHVDLFKFGFSDIVTWHIDNPYAAEMSSKLKVVSKHRIVLKLAKYKFVNFLFLYIYDNR